MGVSPSGASTSEVKAHANYRNLNEKGLLRNKDGHKQLLKM